MSHRIIVFFFTADWFVLRTASDVKSTDDWETIKRLNLCFPQPAPSSELPMFINASGLLVLKLGCHHWSLNFFPPPFLLLFFTLSLPHPNTKYSLSLLLEDFYIYLITLLLTDITLTQTLITLFLEYCKVVFFVCLFVWFFLAALGLPCCERAFSSCGLSTPALGLCCCERASSSCGLSTPALGLRCCERASSSCGLSTPARGLRCCERASSSCGLSTPARGLRCCERASSSCGLSTPALGLRCWERAFSSCGLSTLQLQRADFSCGGFSCGRAWALECTGFRSWGLVAWQHAEGSSTRDQTHVPCTGRWILNPWTTRDVCKTFNYSLSASPLCFLMFANA